MENTKRKYLKILDENINLIYVITMRVSHGLARCFPGHTWVAMSCHGTISSIGSSSNPK